MVNSAGIAKLIAAPTGLEPFAAFEPRTFCPCIHFGGPLRLEGPHSGLRGLGSKIKQQLSKPLKHSPAESAPAARVKRTRSRLLTGPASSSFRPPHSVLRQRHLSTAGSADLRATHRFHRSAASSGHQPRASEGRCRCASTPRGWDRSRWR